MNKFRVILAAMFCTILTCTILGTIFLPREATGLSHDYAELDVDWVRVMEDGSRVPIEVPSQGNVIEDNYTITLECTLPELTDDTRYLYIRSSQQDVFFYIDGELRASYSSTDTRPYGSSSLSSNVFCHLMEEDSGKTLRLTLHTTTSYSDNVNTIYIGSENGLLHLLVHDNGIVILESICLLFAAIVCLIICIFLRSKYPDVFPMEFAAWEALIVSVQALAESKLRQLYFPNMTMAATLSYLMVSLIPFAMSMYGNSLQKGRYKKVYFGFQIVCIANTLTAVILQVTNTADLLQTNIISYILFFLSFIIIGVTNFFDIRKGFFRKNAFPMLGVLLSFIFGGIEIGMVLGQRIVPTGVVMEIGIYSLLLTAIMTSVNDISRYNKERREALAASEAKSDFLARMSHEIRTPINGIIGMDEMILREKDPDKIQGYASEIKDASETLLGIINDILDFSKIESGKMEIINVDYPTIKIFDGLYHTLIYRAKENNLQLIFDVNPGIPKTLYGDNVRIKQILLNILTNSIKYTEKGSVTLKALALPGEDASRIQLQVTVTDTGIGMKQEDLGKLYESFTRIEEKRNRNIEGTGLGMSITKSLVDLIGGTIDIQSEYGKGTSITVTLPQKIVDGQPMGQFSAEPDTTVKVEVNSFTAPDACILVVDDVPMNLKVMKGLLGKTGVKVILADSGQKALVYLKERPFDLVLMDHMMPVMDGIETLKAFRENPGAFNADTPFIIQTANALAGAKEEYLSLGFADYIAKPIAVNDLYQAIEKYLPKDKLIYK